MLLLMDPHFSTMKSINGYITIIPVLRYCMLHTIPKVMLAVVANIYKVVVVVLTKAFRKESVKI